MDKYLEKLKQERSALKVDMEGIKKNITELKVEDFEKVEDYEAKIVELQERNKELVESVKSNQEREKIYVDILKAQEGTLETDVIDKPTPKEEEGMKNMTEEQLRSKIYTDLGKMQVRETVTIDSKVFTNASYNKIVAHIQPTYQLYNAVKKVQMAKDKDTYIVPIADENKDGFIYGEDGSRYPENSVSYGKVEIGKDAYVNLFSATERMLNSVVDYGEDIFYRLTSGIFQKINKDILIGTGKVKGIFTETELLDGSRDVEIDKVDASTLSLILRKYTNVDKPTNTAKLIMSWDTFMDFHDVRNELNIQAYEVDIQNQKINGFDVVIVDNNVEHEKFFIAFGHLEEHYTMPVFSPLKVTSSDEVRFEDGVVVTKGMLEVGGAVVQQNGFVRVSKKAE